LYQRLFWGLPATASIAGTLAVIAVVLAGHDLGTLSSHMAMHIALMNVVAPLAAIAFVKRLRPLSGAAFWSIATLQIGALWFWHLPLMQAATTTYAGALLMHGSLFALALLFWTGVLQLRGPGGWQAILGLIVTGKLSCLLAALLIFSPRFLYMGHHHATSIDDQQLAGLLMITACPVSYVLAGIVIAASMAGVLPVPKPISKHARAA
jgi:putative membrane protein